MKYYFRFDFVFNNKVVGNILHLVFSVYRAAKTHLKTPDNTQQLLEVSKFSATQRIL